MHTPVWQILLVSPFEELLLRKKYRFMPEISFTLEQTWIIPYKELCWISRRCDDKPEVSACEKNHSQSHTLISDGVWLSKDAFDLATHQMTRFCEGLRARWQTAGLIKRPVCERAVIITSALGIRRCSQKGFWWHVTDFFRGGCHVFPFISSMRMIWYAAIWKCLCWHQRTWRYNLEYAGLYKYRLDCGYTLYHTRLVEWKDILRVPQYTGSHLYHSSWTKYLQRSPENNIFGPHFLLICFVGPSTGISKLSDITIGLCDGLCSFLGISLAG